MDASGRFLEFHKQMSYTKAKNSLHMQCIVYDFCKFKKKNKIT